MRNKLILLVEDNSDDELLTVRAIAKTNPDIDVKVVRDGEEAINYLLRQGMYDDRACNMDPDVILLDLKLPKVDGMGVLKAVKSNATTATLPVVVLTTSSEQNDILNSYRLGANSFIRKPVDFQEFTQAINRIGEYWLKLNEQIS